MERYMLILFVVLTNLFINVCGERSLAFVIDNTASMQDEIDQVKSQTKQLFEAVLESDASKFNEFVLVTFNDHSSEIRIKTNDSNKFEDSLRGITLLGNADCPESSMTGILTAIENCPSYSVIYVFTDASAKDYKKFEEVKSLSQKKSIQVTFLLTGLCIGGLTSKMYLVYHRITEATSGQVFHLDESNIKQIIQYINKSTESIKYHLADSYASHCPVYVPFNVNTKTSNVMISCSKMKEIKPKIHNMTLKVVNSLGNDVKSDYVVDLEYIKIIQLRDVKPGYYKAILYCQDTLHTSVSVTGTTSISFKHGFSKYRPSSVNETSTLPLPGEQSFLSIALDNPNKDVTLNTVELIGVDGNVIQKAMDLKLVDAEQQLYITEKNGLPDKMFKIKINGYTKSKETITQVGTTFIEHQKIFGNVDEKSPKTIIIGDPEIFTELNKPLTLKCSVHAYPKPEIIWENDDGHQFQPEVVTVDMTGHFISVLQIRKSNKNAKYYCRARNSIGESKAYANIKIIEEPPVIKSANKYIYGDEKETIDIPCIIIKGNPTPTIVWHKNNNIIRVDEKYRILKNHTLRFIGEVSDNEDVFTCVATNRVGRNEYNFHVTVYAKPKIENTEIYINIFENDVVILPCVAKGYPKPEIRWVKNLESRNSISKDPIFRFAATKFVNGNYTCEASNPVGVDKKTFHVNVYEPPVIKRANEIIYGVEKETIDIPCNIIKGNPTPNIVWRKNNKIIRVGEKYRILKNHTLRFIGEVSDNNEVFKCVAKNRAGSVRKIFHVTVYAKPKIENTEIYKNIVENEVVILPCLAKGNPKPEIRWVKNLESRNSISTDRIFRFAATKSVSGNYTCEASNRVGVDKKTFYVNVYVPVRLKIPKITNITIPMDSRKQLKCEATGYPEPTVQFTYINSTDIMPLQNHSPRNKIKLKATKHGSGFYVCSASNGFNSSNFTYTVNIEESAYITDNRNDYTAVEGDLVLMIPCNAKGNPKPRITWTYGGLTLANTETQIVYDDGTLVLINPDRNMHGSYTCEAKNDLNTDFKTVYVEILTNPKGPGRDDALNETRIVEGIPSTITCYIPHLKKDIVRWFKNGKEIKIGELQLWNPSIRDNGLYTCRVSNEITSMSYHTKVTVGFEPKFLSPGPTGPIQYTEGSNELLDCSAQAEPGAQVKWTHENNEMTVRSTIYKITGMKTTHIGVYTCTLRNDFGEITRKFHIKSEECQLPNDSIGFLPLMVLESSKMAKLKIKNGLMVVPKENPLILSCPGSSFIHPRLEAIDKVKAVCKHDSIFFVRGQNIHFSHLKCKDEIVAYARLNGNACLPNTRKYGQPYSIGYNHSSRFISVYEVCFDSEDNIPAYSRQEFLESISNEFPKPEPSFINGNGMPHDFTQLYDPSRQIRTLSNILGKTFESNSCHFAKKQLITPQDVSPGLIQTATYNYLNFMPHWSCYQQNWEEVEKRIRELALSLRYSVSIWTGTSGRMRLPGSKIDTDVYLSDDFNNRQYVPLYLWKVIQNLEEGAVAIIQVNLPNLTTEEVQKYVKCTDICDRVEGLRNKEWHNVKKGYTFCCNIIDFENKFGVKKMFRGNPKVWGT